MGDGYEEWLAAETAGDPGHRGESGDAVVQMYTSGTTGVPKGVLTTHRNLAAAAETSPHWAFDSESVSLTPLPMFHIGGIGWAFLGLWNGATTILVSEFDPAAVLDMLERRRVTNAVFVPTMLQMLAAVPGAAERDFSALRSIAYGASPITTPVLKAALRTFALLAVRRLRADRDDRRRRAARPGRPRPGRAARASAALGRPAAARGSSCGSSTRSTGGERPPGAVGEVWLRAPNVMAGYFNRPAETAAALTADGWLRTGDGGYVDADGYLFLTDRIKDMIVTGGENVYPIEVEEALSQHPGVARGRGHRRAGRALGRDRQGAIVRPVAGSEPTADELIAFARDRLAGYKLPRIVEFVRAAAHPDGEGPQARPARALRSRLCVAERNRSTSRSASGSSVA